MRGCYEPLSFFPLLSYETLYCTSRIMRHLKKG